ncbi:phage holin family protein [Nocardioides pacificus]
MASEPVKDTDPTIGRLVSDASRDISSLISNEIKLAKSELKVSVSNGATGAGFFAGAAFLGLLAIIMFSIALAYLIHWNGSGLDLHWAYLIVFVLYLLLAGLLAFLGIKKVKKVKAPERAIRQAQESKSLLKRS